MKRREIKLKHQDQFVRIAGRMAKLLEEIREYCPEANMYLEDSGNWNLLTGDSHDDRDEPRQDRIAVFTIVPHSSGGAW